MHPPPARMTQLTPAQRRCGRRATTAMHHLVVWTLLTTAATMLMDDAGVLCAPTPQTPILRTTMRPPPPSQVSSAAPNASAAVDTAAATTNARADTSDLITEANMSTATATATSGGPTATTDDELTADIADLFVANQDFSVIEALEAEAESTAADAVDTSTQQQRSTVTAASERNTNRPTTSAESITSDESGDDDALFDVIIDGTAASNTSETATAAGSHDRVLEVDSEEFFVPADIKERETTTATAVTTSRPTVAQSTTVGSIVSTTVATEIGSSTTSSSFDRNRDTDTDADTIFYISNTEVKVRESAAGVPPPADNAVTTSAHPAQQQPDEELQFFPASYEEDVIIDVRRKNSSAWRIGTGRAGPDRYEEDLIISHPHQHAPPPALHVRNGPDGQVDSTNDENLSISYVGESYIEVKEFSHDLLATGAPDRDEGAVAAAPNYAEYVIIEPIAETPGVTSTTGGPPAIGVPVIEELPPALIKQYTLSSSATSSAEDDQDVNNEIVPPIRANTKHFGNAMRSTTTVEHPTDGTAVPLNEQTSGGATTMLHDWLSGVFGKNVPSKRNNHVGGTSGAGGASSSIATVVAGPNRTVAVASAADVNGTLEVSAAVSVMNATGAGLSESRTEKSDELMLEMNSFYYWFSPVLLLACCLIFGSTLAYYIRNYQMPGYYTFLSWLHLDTSPKDRNNDTSASSVITVVANQIEISPDGDHRPNDSIDFISVRHGSMLSDQQFELHALNPSAQLHAPAPAPIARSASVVPATSLIASSASLSSASASTCGGPNGSLITMTMKNNQLIVETEERNDIARNARETKVHYNSPSDPEAVFVVEVSRGADSVDAPNNYADQPPPQQQAPPLLPSSQTGVERPTATQPEPVQQRDDAALLHNEEVQVHQPPADTIVDSAVGVATTVAVAAAGMLKTNTGLSQSDLSVASSSGSTRGYNYGEQAAYAVEAPGYQATVNNAQAVAVPPEPKSLAPGVTSVIATATHSPANGKPHPELATKLEAANDLNRSAKPQTNGEIFAANKMPPAVLTNGTGCNGVAEDGGCNGIGGAGCGAFDSLMNLPDPPSMDEIKLLNEFAMSENNNMDSLPPPPLELMDGGITGVN